MYFATDGRPRLGGLDIFVSKILNNATFDKVQNIGEPVNTKFDDFAFIIDSNTRNGCFSSNKKGAMGNDDIYKFTETRKLVCEIKLKGTISDGNSNTVIENVKVISLDEKLQVLEEVLTGKDGSYSFKVNCSKAYNVRVTGAGYPIKENQVTVSYAVDNKLNFTLEKQKVEIQEPKPIAIGTYLAKTLNISIIYFDLAESNITDKAAIEVEKIFAVMQKYPKMKIDIRSHTDSRSYVKIKYGFI